MTIKPEVLAALDRIEYVKILGFGDDWKAVRAELLAMDAELVSLRKISVAISTTVGGKIPSHAENAE